jgi:hypothetical protein
MEPKAGFMRVCTLEGLEIICTIHPPPPRTFSLHIYEGRRSYYFTHGHMTHYS